MASVARRFHLHLCCSRPRRPLYGAAAMRRTNWRPRYRWWSTPVRHPVASDRRIGLRLPVLAVRRRTSARPGSRWSSSAKTCSATRTRCARAPSITRWWPRTSRCSIRRLPCDLHCRLSGVQVGSSARAAWAGIAARNQAAAALLYDYIDASGFYQNRVAREDRSWMNVPFFLADPALDKEFLVCAQRSAAAAVERASFGMACALRSTTRADRVACAPWSIT